MRLRSLVAMAATSVLSLHAQAQWPAYDANQDGVINFADLNAALSGGNFLVLNGVLSYWGQLVAPEVVGNPNAPGADAQAIARWNAIPGEFVGSTARVGVLAYHMNEIKEVRFFLNSAPLGVVRERSINPSTGNPEFWIAFSTANFADGQEINLTAIVLPNVGKPRILQGEFNSSAANVGEHGLPLVVRRGAPPAVYVGYNGDDSNPGTRQAPFATIGKALRVVPDGGEVILLNAGGYWMPENAAGHTYRANERWITVRPDAGIPREAIGITAENRGNLRANIRRLRWKDVTFDFKFVAQIYNTNEQIAWLDGCIMMDSDGWGVDGKPSPVRNPYFATNCVARNKLYAFTNATLVRNSVAKKISGDVFQNARVVVGCTADNIDGTVLEHHTDLFQVFGGAENIIYSQIVATNMRSTQSIFLEPTYQSPSGAPVYTMKDAALVDILVDIEPVFRWSNNDDGMVNWGGPPWSQMLSKFNHVVFERVELANQRMMIRTDVSSNQSFEARNVVYRDCGLHPMTHQSYVASDSPPEGVTFSGCYPHPDAAVWEE
jgi:hypothetical protein